MAVDVDICNGALIKLGVEPINALSDNTKQARLCNLRYQPVLQAALRTAPWSFAIKRAALTPTVVTLEFGDETVFTLPIDCVRVCKIDECGTATYKIEGRTILSNDVDEVELTYVSSAISPTSFDFVFIQAAECMLAADLCYSLTQSQAMVQGLLQMAEWWISQARSYNSQEKTAESYKFDTFLNARQGGSEIFE
jgi:hypothetical protein